jgi:uncharacterized membrane protein
LNKSRVEAFSDGVFAIAITLLVLGLQVPELKRAGDQELRQALLSTAAQLFPYATSFATIGIIWLNHHAMFHFVHRVEHTTLTLNLILLMIVSFIPYPTAVLSKYGALPSATFLYGSVLTLLGITYTVLWSHLVRQQLCHLATDVKIENRRNIIGAILYPLATVLSLWFPHLSIAIYFSLAAFYLLRIGVKQANANVEHKC